MKGKLIAALISVASLSLPLGVAAQEKAPEGFAGAVELYTHGMFGRAGTIFGEIYASTGDVMAGGYEALCAVRLQERGGDTLADEYLEAHPYSSLVPQIRFYKALNYFDRQDYEAAAREFSLVGTRTLRKDQIAEYSFKEAYSWFGLGDLDRAAKLFARTENMPHSDYTAPSRYSLAYILYSQKDFKEACSWFEKAAGDPRFAEISQYYMVDCRYMLKDYSYVLKTGKAIYDSQPKERQQHLARIISESFLARGDAEGAREYYDKVNLGSAGMDRDDRFYAGSVLYATGDYKGAVENYSLMKDRTDSIGQIANYQLAYSYIRTGNKVAALEAFKDASELSFNPDVQEDAHFNYAKLSFDLNHNPTVFNDYIAKYSDRKKGDGIYSYMALASLYGHDYAGAVEAYSNIDLLDKDQKSNYVKANYLRADQLIGNGSWRDAVPYLKAASLYSDRHSSLNQLAKYWLGEAEYRSGKYDEAADTFKDLYNNSALDGKEEGRLIPYDIAYCLFSQEDYAGAAKWFDEYLRENNPSEGEDAAARRADCDFIRQDYKAAVSGYESAMDRFPYSDNLYPAYRAGIAQGLLGSNDKKIEALSRALRTDSSAEYWSEAVYELGRAYVASGNNDAAIGAFTKLREGTKDKTIAARTLIELGMISRNMSEYDKSLDYYKQVISEMPGTEYARDALLAIESIYQSQGRADEYLDFADKVGAIKDKSDSEKEGMYFTAAEQMFLTENYAKARTSLLNYLDRYPSGSHVAQAQFYVAECYRLTGKKEQACDWYNKALGSDDEASFAETAMLNFSRLSYDLQRYKDAYGGYSSLLQSAGMENNRHTARVGMMRSAYKAADYRTAISCAGKVRSDSASSQAEVREADYLEAKSLLSTNERSAAFAIFEKLSAAPATAEGAESAYMVIQDAYDQGKYDTVASKVYAFSEKSGDQSYWLAKAFIVLGDSFAEQDNYSQAKATFESILNGYTPAEGTSDDVLDNVRMRLEKLKKLM